MKTQKWLRHRFTFVSNNFIGWHRSGNSSHPYCYWIFTHGLFKFSFIFFFLFSFRSKVRGYTVRHTVRWNIFIFFFFISFCSNSVRFAQPLPIPGFLCFKCWYNIRETIPSSLISSIISKAKNPSENLKNIDEWKISWMNSFTWL